MAFPFSGQEFTFTQPDNTKIKVKGWGNQYYAVFETLDGFTIIKNPDTGFYEYAQLTDSGNELESTGIKVGMPIPSTLQLVPKLRIDSTAAKSQADEVKRLQPQGVWEIRRQNAKNARLTPPTPGLAPAPPSRTTTGIFVGLCLLIEFPDDRASIAQSEIANFCNQRGYRNYGNNGSVFDYFYDNSQGKVQYTNIVTPYYLAQHEKSYYTDELIPYTQRAIELINEALTYFKNQGFDFSQLTADNNSNIYALNVFYAGDIQNNWSEGLWPHQFNLGSFATSSGKKFSDYQVTNIGNNLSIGTFCHENGHMLCDFPDLYDYGDQSQGIGYYCLMCAGNNANPKNPIQVSAYLKYRAGWASSVRSVTPGSRIDIAAGTNDFIIHPHPTKLAEYFIIENRSASRRDASLPSEGLAIWHIDERGDNQNEQMTATQHYECSLEQGDGRFDLERNRNQGDAQDLFSANRSRSFGDATLPNSKWWDGTPSGLEITNISLPGLSMTLQIPPAIGGVYTLTAGANTIIKQSTEPSQSLADDEKFALLAGGTIELSDYRSATNNHWELELSTPKNGISQWFAFKPHVKIE
jgi:M6 family metalloprotease-like protein